MRYLHWHPTSEGWSTGKNQAADWEILKEEIWRSVWVLKHLQKQEKNSSRKVWVAAGVSVDTEIYLQIEELTQKFQRRPWNILGTTWISLENCLQKRSVVPPKLSPWTHWQISKEQGQVTCWKTALEQLCLWYEAMAEKLHQQRERDTRFLSLRA